MNRSKHGSAHAIDMLHGGIWNKIPQFALPLACTGILEQLFNATGIAIAGNFAPVNGTAAIAAIGANTPIIGFIVSLFIGISLGANVAIAIAIGRGDSRAVHRHVHTAVVMSAAGGLLVTLLGELAAEPVLKLLNIPEEVLPLALLYLRIYLAGMPAILLFTFEAAVFRSIGDSRTPLAVLAMAGVLNVLLSLFFVAVLGMTVNGTALATVLANIFGCLLLLRGLTRTHSIIRVRFGLLRADRGSLKQILRTGLPAGVQSGVFNGANIVVQAFINNLGTNVLAASSAALCIELVTCYVLTSFGQACTTFVGQNYGAGQIRRCRRIFVLCLAESCLAAASAVLLILFFGRFALSLFNADPQVIELGYLRLVIIFIAYIFTMLYEVMSGYLRGLASHLFRPF